MTSNLTRSVAKVLNKISKNTNNQSNPSQGKRRSKRRGRRYRRNTRGPDGILAGYGSPITTMFSSRSTPDGLIVQGYDLVTSFTFGDNISYYITANPAAWNGTRIAAIAGGFQNYRPLKFRIHYRPQVGSTDDRSMFIGTLWQTNYITDRTQIEPSLLTSPGGVYLPAWNDSVSNVNLQTCLPQRMFPTRDPHFTTVPFSVIARSSQGGPDSRSTTMPGRIFIEYTYEFRNAIGSGTGFSPSRVIPVEVTYRNGGEDLITVGTPDIGVPSGVIVDVRYVNDTVGDVGFNFSENIPLGGIISFDKFGNTLPATYYVKINGKYVAYMPISQNFYIYVYTDNGSP